MAILETAPLVNRPDDLIPETQKGRDWILQYMRWMYCDYDRNCNNEMFFGNRGKYAMIKDYAMGKQSIEKYKPMLDIDQVTNETWMNVDYSIIPIFPKFRRIALRKINKVGYNIVATPVDAMAENQKNKRFADMKAKIKLREALGALGSPIANNPDLQPKEREPEDLKELEIMFQYSYKHDMAMEMENAIKLVFYQNDIEAIQRQVKEDVFDLGVGIVKRYIDSNGAIKIRRVNPERFITNYCKKKDFSDKQYGGEIIEMTLAELKELAQDQFSAMEYQNLAEMLMGSYGNLSEPPGDTDDLNAWYDTLKLRVLDAEFFSVNQLSHEKVIDKRGNLLIGNAYVDQKGRLRGELVRTSYKVVYQGMWIVGTNYVFNYGLKTNMVRAKQSLGDTDLSYKVYAPDFYKMTATSISEQVIPIIDQIQMDWYHLQNVKNQAVPKGISIEMGALENIAMGKGGAVFSKMEVIDLWKKTGVLVWRRIDRAGHNQELRPIEDLKNGIGDDAKFYFDSMMSNIGLLKELAGLNDFTDASNPNARATNTLASMAYEGTDNALGHVLEANKYLLEKISTETMLALQDLVSMGADISGYVRGLGDAAFKFFKLSENVSNYEYGIMLEDKPTDDERNLFLQEAEAALKANQIKYSDLVYIRSIDNLKEAEMVLGYKIDKWLAQQGQQSMAVQQQNAQVQMQSNQMAEQVKQQTLQLEAELKMKQIQLEKDLEMRNDGIKFQHDLQLKQMTNNAGVVETLITADSQEFIAQKKLEGQAQDQAHKDAQIILKNKTDNQ